VLENNVAFQSLYQMPKCNVQLIVSDETFSKVIKVKIQVWFHTRAQQCMFIFKLIISAYTWLQENYSTAADWIVWCNYIDWLHACCYEIGRTSTTNNVKKGPEKAKNPKIPTSVLYSQGRTHAVLHQELSTGRDEIYTYTTVFTSTIMPILTGSAKSWSGHWILDSGMDSGHQ